MHKNKRFLAAISLTGVMLVTSLALTLASPKKNVKVAKPAVNKALITEGKKLFTTAAPRCDMCHATSAKVKKMGPNLAQIGKTWSASKLTTVIRDPKKIDPKGTMPAYDKSKLNDKQLKAMVAYLQSLK